MVANTLLKLGVVQAPTLSLTAPKRMSRNQYKTINAAPYAPDAEFEGLLNESRTVFDFTKATDPFDREYEASGQLYEVAKDGKSYKLRRFSSKAELLETLSEAEATWKLIEGQHFEVDPPWKLRETNDVKRDESIEAVANRVLNERLTNDVTSTLKETDLSEATVSGGGFDYGDYPDTGRGTFQDYATTTYGQGQNPEATYIPLMGGPWAKQLYLHAYLDQHAKAFEAFNHNPLAKQLINLTTYYTIGRALDHRSTNFEVDEVWREFVDRTKFYDKLSDIMTSFWWAGDLFIEFYDDAPKKGYTDFRTLDPSTIWDIITDPEDMEKAYYAHQQYSTPYQNNYASSVGPTRQVDMVRYVIRHIPSDQYLQYKVNVSPWEKRGRSDLFSILGWLKRLKDLMNARVVKGQLEAAFVWDIETSSDDVSLTSGNLPDPWKPGSTFIHNKAIKLTPQTSTIKSGEAMGDVQALMNFCAIGVGTPKELVGETARGSSSSVLASTGPGVKRYETRQALIDRICHAVADRVLNNAVAAGRITPDDFLSDAHTVRRLATRSADEQNRDEVMEDMEQAKSDADDQAQQDKQTQLTMNQKAQDQNHQVAMASANGTPQQLPKPTPLVNVNRTAKTKEALANPDNNQKLNAKQERRIKSIKATGSFSREIIEFMFPPIAQEDRSAKLKDLALSEAMEWLPKSVVASLAAKELNISTYDFEDAWAQIVEEALLGLSIAHVYGQDGKHVPSTVMAQDVQAEMTAKEPPQSAAFQNVPIPPPVAGDKLVPTAGGALGANGKPAGPPALNKPNTGDTKVNNKAAPAGPPNPTSASPARSNAGKDPMGSEGIANIKRKKEAQAELSSLIREQILKEAIGPVMGIRAELARYLLKDGDGILDEIKELVDSAST